MKNLFTFTKRKDAQSSLITISKIIKIFYIVFASGWALFSIIQGVIALNDSDGGIIFLSLVVAAFGFFLLIFIGWVHEVVLLGFSAIVHNQHDELVGKNKEDETENYDNDFYSRMKKLHNLKELGIITEEEFELKKKDALAGL